jgi:hypothetical protein
MNFKWPICKGQRDIATIEKLFTFYTRRLMSLRGLLKEIAVSFSTIAICQTIGEIFDFVISMTDLSTARTTARIFNGILLTSTTAIDRLMNKMITTDKVRAILITVTVFFSFFC